MDKYKELVKFYDNIMWYLREKIADVFGMGYEQGYEDAKEEFIGMSATQMQIKYQDDFETALKKMHDYPEKIEKPCDVCAHNNHGLCVQPKKKPCRNYSLWQMRKESE